MNQPLNSTVRSLLSANLEHAKSFDDRFDHVQDGQQPSAVTICCSDSRVLQDHMWANDRPGEIFTCSNIGNRVTQRTGDGLAIAGDVLYPVEHTGTTTVIVVGHTGCGAVTATYNHLKSPLDEPRGIQACIERLKPGIREGMDELPADVDESQAINRLVEWNVDRQVEHLLYADVLPDDVDVIGTVYDFQDVYGGRRGEIHVINVNGTTSADQLRDDHPEISDRISRLNE